MSTTVKIALFTMTLVAAIAIWSTIDKSPQQESAEVNVTESSESKPTSAAAPSVQSLVLQAPEAATGGDAVNPSRTIVDYSHDATELDQDDAVENAADALDHPSKQPLLGNDLTKEQWDIKRESGRQAEALLLVTGDDQEPSAEQSEYLRDWQAKTLANQTRVAEIESDVRRLAPDFVGSPTIEKQETVRSQGEEAERLLAPYTNNPNE